MVPQQKYVAADPDNGSRKSVKLSVVAMRGYRRRMTWEETGLPWVPPSPNMPTPRTALAYVGARASEWVPTAARGKGQPRLSSWWRDMGGWATRGLSHETNTCARGSVHRATELFERVTAAEVRGGGGGAGPGRRGRSSVKRGLNYRPNYAESSPGNSPRKNGARLLARLRARRRRQEAPRREERQGEREEEEQEQTEPTAERENDSEFATEPPSMDPRRSTARRISPQPRGRCRDESCPACRCTRAESRTPCSGRESRFCWPSGGATPRSLRGGSRRRCGPGSRTRDGAPRTRRCCAPPPNPPTPTTPGRDDTPMNAPRTTGTAPRTIAAGAATTARFPGSPESARRPGRRPGLPRDRPSPGRPRRPRDGDPKKAPFIDMLTGSAALREAVEAADDEKVEGVIVEWESQLGRSSAGSQARVPPLRLTRGGRGGAYASARARDTARCHLS